MLVECKLGPTTQTIGTRTYEFKLDAAGRAACDVGSDHLYIFLARARVYRLAGAISEPMSQKVEPVAPGFRDSLGENLNSGDVLVTLLERKPRRGRPGIDDRRALAELHRLVEAGTGLNKAAGMIASSSAAGDARDRRTASGNGCFGNTRVGCHAERSAAGRCGKNGWTG
jgi:hypothetical protein